MKPNTIPKLPPSLRPRPKGPDISEGFAPIVAAIKPAPPAAPPVPATPSPALRKSYTPKAAPAANPRIAPLEGRVAMFAGTFQPEGADPFECETPLTGVAATDRQSLINLARKRFPKNGLRLKSTRIYTKEIGTPAGFSKGTSVGQLFGEPGSPSENAVEIGSVFHSGEKCLVILVNLRSRNSVTINLRPPGGGKIAFSNQLAANLPASNLKAIVREVLGSDCRELEITLKESA